LNLVDKKVKEKEWAIYVTDKLNKELSRNRSGLKAEVGKKLIYANEIKEYRNDSPDYYDMSYETDILIYESFQDKSWKPRVVIETKIDSVTTHDAITYSQKSATHKYVHPYLRYGIFLGNRKHHPLPGRLFRHGAHFDFMISWKNYEASTKEWQILINILRSEIDASEKLEEMIFDSRKQNRKKYFVLHKPLMTKELE